jgi:hypothetical protein
VLVIQPLLRLRDMPCIGLTSSIVIILVVLSVCLSFDSADTEHNWLLLQYFRAVVGVTLLTHSKLSYVLSLIFFAEHRAFEHIEQCLNRLP